MKLSGVSMEGGIEVEVVEMVKRNQTHFKIKKSFLTFW